MRCDDPRGMIAAWRSQMANPHKAKQVIATDNHTAPITAEGTGEGPDGHETSTKCTISAQLHLAREERPSMSSSRVAVVAERQSTRSKHGPSDTYQRTRKGPKNGTPSKLAGACYHPERAVIQETTKSTLSPHRPAHLGISSTRATGSPRRRKRQ